MTLDEKIYALWIADVTATALVPADRFKPPGNYQNIAAPYVVFYPIFMTPFDTTASANSIEKGTYQFSIYASSYSQCDTIRRKLLAVLDGNQDGFNFRYRSSRFINEVNENAAGLVLLVLDYLVSTAAPAVS
jgi:hypothetical protein